MELKLVYRFLRQVSDWTVNGYYSDVYVEGHENVPKHGPVILAPTHHNEIIDIATLSITIPHHRQVSFWAKSTMFKNPLVGQFLSSSGAIPVKRNPNAGGADKKVDATVSQADLFKSTTLALAADQVVGIFPEGTSYTQPAIVQVLSGAAWAAIEYSRWAQQQHGGDREDAVIVPVGIVYTDKSQYQSKVRVQYGKPIKMSEYTGALRNAESVEDTRELVKTITADLDARLRAITINAPDWDTKYAASVAQTILYPEEYIPLEHWVQSSQSMVERYSEDTPLRASLVKYSALLHYSKLSHHTLEYLYPRSSRSLFKFIALPWHIIQSVLFVPPLLSYAPSYLCGYLAGKYLAAKGEEEGQAQFKAVFGGVGLGVYWGVLGKLFGKRALGWGIQLARKWTQSGVADVLERLRDGGKAGRLMCFLGLGYFMIKWHNLLVKANLRRFNTTIAAYRIACGLLRRKPTPEKAAVIEQYTQPPPPPTNTFIRKRRTEGAAESTQHKALPPVAPSLLVRRLLQQREEVMAGLGL